MQIERKDDLTCVGLRVLWSKKTAMALKEINQTEKVYAGAEPLQIGLLKGTCSLLYSYSPMRTSHPMKHRLYHETH